LDNIPAAMRLEASSHSPLIPNFANNDCDDDVVIAVYVRDSCGYAPTLKSTFCWQNDARDIARRSFLSRYLSN
jgi:hypothetical protein